MLIFQRSGSAWMIALYRRKMTNEKAPEINAELWKSVRKTWMVAGQKREDWTRFTFQAPRLFDGIKFACEMSHPPVDIDEVTAYIRATSWGKDLPL